MSVMNFITVRLGKDSIADIKKLCDANVGVLNEKILISVKCTQIPDSYGLGDYAFVWLGSDNNKGVQTKWKQGFKAVGIVKDVHRAEKYNKVVLMTMLTKPLERWLVILFAILKLSFVYLIK